MERRLNILAEATTARYNYVPFAFYPNVSSSTLQLLFVGFRCDRGRQSSSGA
jgi:hypothetical protein